MDSPQDTEQLIILKDIQTKLNDIQSKLEEKSLPTTIEHALEEAKKYMMENYNIGWLNDSVEDDIYEVIIGVVSQFLRKTL